MVPIAPIMRASSQSVFLLGITFVCSVTQVFAENASNPLAAVSNVDMRLQYFDLGESADRRDYWGEGAYMLTPKLKLKYELHYWDTDVTGSSESD
jgi:hypothetical protein